MKQITFTVITLLIIAQLFLQFPEIELVKATSSVTSPIIIREDGTVEPENAPILKRGNIYQLTENINVAIAIQRDNVVFDGNGHSIKPVGHITRPIKIFHRENVTVQNCVIQGGEVGIMVDRSSKIFVLNNSVSGTSALFPGLQPTGGVSFWIVDSGIISGNNFSENYGGICLGSHSDNNLVVGNNIINNEKGIWVYDSKNNTIIKNNFKNNTVQVFGAESTVINKWNNTSVGNYWSDYKGTDADGNGIGDTPYYVTDNNQDNHPLMEPAAISTIPEFSSGMFLVVGLFAVTVLTIFSRYGLIQVRKR
jgi:parallel beta-helix repeat protein